MRSGAFKAGILIAALVLGTYVIFEGDRVGKELGLVEEEPVLVFVVPLPENARRIRAAVSQQRVVWEGDAGFALVGERVVTSSFETVGEVIKGAGWIDRPIRIVSLEADPAEEASESEAGHPASREERLARLRQLVHQSTLSAGEQRFILQAMSDGIEI